MKVLGQMVCVHLQFDKYFKLLLIEATWFFNPHWQSINKYDFYVFINPVCYQTGWSLPFRVNNNKNKSVLL